MSQIITHESNSTPIGQRVADGYINATALCKAAGKRLDRYFENQSTKEYLEALSCKSGVEISSKNPLPGKQGNSLIQVFQGIDQPMQGTWVNPKVAIHLGMWLSPEFAVQVTEWVHDWMNTGKQTPPAPHPEQKALNWTPPPLYPNMTEATFKALPAADQDHFAETPAERSERIRRESREIRARYYY